MKSPHIHSYDSMKQGIWIFTMFILTQTSKILYLFGYQKYTLDFLGRLDSALRYSKDENDVPMRFYKSEIIYVFVVWFLLFIILPLSLIRVNQ